jgi:hypothetical protein
VDQPRSSASSYTFITTPIGARLTNLSRSG